MKRGMVLVLLALSSCTVLNPRHLPRPPGGRRLTLEQAQGYVRKMSTPQMHNRRYYRAFPR
jgi:hypothetical protein